MFVKRCCNIFISISCLLARVGRCVNILVAAPVLTCLPRRVSHDPHLSPIHWEPESLRTTPRCLQLMDRLSLPRVASTSPQQGNVNTGCFCDKDSRNVDNFFVRHSVVDVVYTFYTSPHLPPLMSFG